MLLWVLKLFYCLPLQSGPSSDLGSLCSWPARYLSLRSLGIFLQLWAISWFLPLSHLWFYLSPPFTLHSLLTVSGFFLFKALKFKALPQRDANKDGPIIGRQTSQLVVKPFMKGWIELFVSELKYLLFSTIICTRKHSIHTEWFVFTLNMEHLSVSKPLVLCC